jgi:hypothetical protein
LYELYINNGEHLLRPRVVEGVKWDLDISGSAGKLTFDVYSDQKLVFEEGNPVMLKSGDEGIFYGFVFTKKRDPAKKTIKVTAYDQRRYLKNKATYSYENKKAGEVLQMIAEDFRLELGYIEDTEYVIPARVEENRSLFDIIITALNLTVQNCGKMFVLGDEFGKLTIRNIEDLKLNILIDEQTAKSYDYETSIDKDVYNKIKITQENKSSGGVDVYIAQDSANINKWGLLQYLDGTQEGINPENQADSLLELYNNKLNKLSLKDVIGDVRYRPGYSPIIYLKLDDRVISHYMVIVSATHSFKNREHFTNLKLRGGGFDSD